MKKVFLYETKDPAWRDELIPMLKIGHSTDIQEKAACDFVLYVVTPDDPGFYIIAEAVHYSNRQPDKTLFCVLEEGYRGTTFNMDQGGTLVAVCDLIRSNGGKVFVALEQVANYLNKFSVEIKYDPNMVECLIERDGPTLVTLGKSRYAFKKNDAGHSVCLVMLKDHRNYLTSLPDFRIYMKHKLPKPEFTDEELDFMREWKTKSKDDFLAYVNGRIDRFNKSSDKIRAIAIDKWKKILPKMQCPIQIPVLKTVIDDIATEEAPGLNDWLTLSAKNFEEYVRSHPEVFKFGASDEVTKAKDKWDRLISSKTGEPWPIGDEQNGRV